MTDRYQDHQGILYACRDSALWMMDCHEFQRYACGRLKKPILNVACGPDRARLSDFGAINMDFERPSTRTPPDKDPDNFETGNMLQMKYGDGAFKTVVLGETLEHCTYDVAVKVMRECRRVLSDSGNLVLTFPIDARPFEEQKFFFSDDPKNEPVIEYSGGVTHMHQTYWDMMKLNRLLDESGFKEVAPRAILFYFFTSPVCGYGMVLGKME